MLFRPSLFLPLSLGAIADLAFDLMNGLNRLPCVRGRLTGFDGNGRCFHLLLPSGDILLRATHQFDYSRDILLQCAPGQNSNCLRIDRSRASVPEDWWEYENYIGVGIGSEFGAAVGSILLLPKNPDQVGAGFTMILNATNPNTYCYRKCCTRNHELC